MADKTEGIQLLSALLELTKIQIGLLREIRNDLKDTGGGRTAAQPTERVKADRARHDSANRKNAHELMRTVAYRLLKEEGCEMPTNDDVAAKMQQLLVNRETGGEMKGVSKSAEKT